MAAAQPVDTDAANWLAQIEQAEKRAEKWEKRGDRVVKRYRDERGESGEGSSSKRMNLLWSNVQTLVPSLYGREPVPIAERRFLDKDKTGRVASQILERALRYEMKDCGFHDAVSQCVLDYCLPGRGTAWLRFVPVVGPSSSVEPHGDDQISDVEPDDPTSAEAADRQAALGDDETHEQSGDEELLGASVEVDYVFWKDFLHSKARTWKEVEWVARRIFMGREDLCDRFGDAVGRRVPLENAPADENRKAEERASETTKKAIVFEIWYKPKRQVYFIAKGFDELLEEPSDDPLNLEGFWPCPRPLFTTLTNETLEPVPDFTEYQDQADEIDTLTVRLDLLISAIRVAGVYDASQKGLERLLDERRENQLIPVSTWAAFAEKGGLNGAISFLPIKDIAAVVGSLSEARDKAKQDLYEVTGMADVIRGQSDPRETAEAVKTKGRFGSLRLQARQKDVARFCRDIVCMMGEIIAQHFPDETLINVSGIMYEDGIGPDLPQAPTPPQQPALPPPAQATPPQAPVQPGQMNGAPAPQMPPPPSPMQQYAQAMVAYRAAYQQAMQQKMQAIMSAIGLLRQDKLRGFRIDIETDSTIADDAADEKEARVEFLSSASGFLKQAMEAGAQYPQMVPLLGKMMLFGIRGFRTGRDLESSFEEFIDHAEKDAKEKMENPPPQKPDPEMIKAQAAAQKAQAEIQAQQIEADSERSNAQMRLQQSQLDFQGKQFSASVDMQRLEAEKQKIAQQAALDAASHAQQMEELEMKRQMMAAQHAQSMRTIGASAE